MTGDWHESQDLTQDTFVQAFKAIEAARQASGANFHAKAWLMQIAVNVVRMSRRRRSSIRVVVVCRIKRLMATLDTGGEVEERLDLIH